MAATVAVSGSAFAAASTEFDKAVTERYRAVEAAIEARDGNRWFDVLYSKDIVLTGEGTKEVIRGRDALLPVIAGIVKGTASCKLIPDGARRSSGDIGYSFVTYDCKPADATAANYQVRALFVWQREKAGWRVVAESYTMGGM
ncbi:hypothetical protein CJ010_15770 [Azoarcus sp. DD4]|nr:hypothetical protein CJ010_15770 [Azoarcus sp. DD4]